MNDYLPTRRPTRLRDYDYSREGIYFVTVCTLRRAAILSTIVGGGALDAPSVCLTDLGRVVQKYIESSDKIPGVAVDKYVIMPDHIHMIIRVRQTDKSPSSETSRAPSIGTSRAPSIGTSRAPSIGTSRAPSIGTSRAPSPTGDANAVVPRVVGAIKRLVHREIGKTIFQRSYYDRIIRNKTEYQTIWQYIENNPYNKST